MSRVNERVTDLVAPALGQVGLELVDVQLSGNVLRVTIDRPGGVDLDTISDTSRVISEELDRHDADLDGVVPGRYVLEVSSPGIERPLRTPEHFRRFIGTAVTVKTQPGTEGDRRVDGVLESADDEGIVVDGRSIAYADIERARTRFVWPEPAPKAPKAPKKAGARR